MSTKETRGDRFNETFTCYLCVVDNFTWPIVQYNFCIRGLEEIKRRDEFYNTDEWNDLLR